MQVDIMKAVKEHNARMLLQVLELGGVGLEYYHYLRRRGRGVKK